MQTIKYNDLDEQKKELIDHATRAMENAYNPYSGFFVGAAIRTKNNKIITGSNVENAAYGSCICAERAAILRANAEGIKEYSMIAINARGTDFDTSEVTAPCGSCRQMIFESSQVAEHNIEIILSTTQKDTIILTSIQELLPLAFGPKNLGIDIQSYKD